MSMTGEQPTTGDGPAIPTSAWAFGWSFVGAQVLELVRRGAQDESAWFLSALLGIVLVTFFAHGVMRARMIRFWIVVVLIGLMVVLGTVGLLLDPTAWGAVSVAIAIVQAALLRSYARSAWFAWQRTRPAGGPSLAPILAVAVLVGGLGGVLGASTQAADDLTVRVG